MAICTHPDNDHKDVFFELINDNEVQIKEFWLTDTAQYLNVDDIKGYRNNTEAINTVRKIWNKSNDYSLNLIDLLLEKGIMLKNVIDGVKHTFLPFYIVGPEPNFYKKALKQMVADYDVRIYEMIDEAKFDPVFHISEEEAKINLNSEDDISPYNASSLIVFYQPSDDKKLLFAGDANTVSLEMTLKKYEWLRNIDFLKVPHHGNKYNLNSFIIDAFAPKKSYISAFGNINKPSVAVVYWLNKYGLVYLTSQLNCYIRCVNNPRIIKRHTSK